MAINRGTLSVTTSGPLFDGRAPDEIQALSTAALDQVAAAGAGIVRDNSKGSFKNPTPYYWTRIGVDGDGALLRRVTDQGVVYGPWLEGISSRNRTSRFKGYAMWRRAVAELEKRVPRLVKAAVERTVGRLS